MGVEREMQRCAQVSVDIAFIVEFDRRVLDETIKPRQRRHRGFRGGLGLARRSREEHVMVGHHQVLRDEETGRQDFPADVLIHESDATD